MTLAVIFGKYYHPFEGGVEINTRDICESLAKIINVRVLAFQHEAKVPSNTEIEKVEIIRFVPLVTIKSQPLSIKYFFACLVTKADVIHFHAPNFVAAAALMCRQIFGDRTPVVVTHHMDVVGKGMLRAVVIWIYRYIARRSVAVLVTSLKNAENSADLPSHCAVEVVPLGVKLEDYRIDETILQEARVWRSKTFGSSPLLSFVGRIVKYKGLDVLVRALATIPEARLVVGGEGPERSTLEGLAEELGVRDRIAFLGSITHQEKLKIVAASDIFVFPSSQRTEAFGISQVEAMAMGKAVIATRLNTGVTDVAVDGYSALLAEPGDEITLAAGIRRLIDNDALRTALGARAKRHVEENFSLERTTRLTQDLILRCVNGAD